MAMAYKRVKLTTQLAKVGIRAVRDGKKILVFYYKAPIVQVADEDYLYDTKGMGFDMSTIKDATDEEKALFPSDGP
jgi:hypothetical protein